jgi:hypothetical protein
VLLTEVQIILSLQPLNLADNSFGWRILGSSSELCSLEGAMNYSECTALARVAATHAGAGKKFPLKIALFSVQISLP